MGSSDTKPLWALDLGNTKLKLAKFIGGYISELHTYLRSDSKEALDFLSQEEASGYSLLSTGIGEEVWVDRLRSIAPVWSYAPEDPCPLQVEYLTPHTLGLDRLAAAVGAYALYPGQDVLVIDAGTCLTYERISAAKEYLGGNIAPGLSMRLQSMHEFTGKLPQVPLDLPPGLWGTDTTTAMQLGGIQGCVFELLGVISAFRQNTKQSRVILCGGDGPFLRPHLPSDIIYRPTIVLEGLAQLHAYAH